MAITDLTGTKWKFDKSFTHLYNGATNNDWHHAYVVEAQATFGDIIVDIPQVRGNNDHNEISFPSAGVMSLRPHAVSFPTLSKGSTVYPYWYAKYISSNASENAGKWVITQYPTTSANSKIETVYDGDAYITFTGGADVTNATLISYMEQIAVQVEEEPEATATVITYNGSTIATLEAGQTATIKTAETEVEHDIVITPVFPINIAYGDIIATAEAGQTATVKTANTEVDFDIVVSAKAEEANYLTFSSPSSFTLNTSSSNKTWDGMLEYSTDASAWNVWDGKTTLSADNGKLYLRGTGNTQISSGIKWVLIGSDIACEGNIENLLDYATVANGEHPTMADNCCWSMFQNCTSLISAPALPATTLATSCYSLMFEGCTSLVNAPALPATTLAEKCYMKMFRGCTSLVNVPALPATTLANNGYANMFEGCTSLASIPALPALNIPTYCYYWMFRYCTNIKISTTQTEEYCNEYRIPTSGGATTGDYALRNMFGDTGGTFKSDPSLNTTYYTSNTVVY